MDLTTLFNQNIPSPSKVIEKAIQNRPDFSRYDPDYIKNHFSELIEELQDDTYKIYSEVEKLAGKRAIEESIRRNLSPLSFEKDVIETAGSMFSDLERFFLSLTQSRRPRADKTFVEILKMLFKKLGYPFDDHSVKDGEPDILMPHGRHYKVNPRDCILFTAERNLWGRLGGERLRHIVCDFRECLGLYIATFDETVVSMQLNAMLPNTTYIITGMGSMARMSIIYLVVPARIKENDYTYREAHNVISFEDFLKYHLDPAMTKWRENAVI